MTDTKHTGLPVAGYKPQSNDAVAVVNGFKQDEERLLRKLDEMNALTAPDSDASSKRSQQYDQRWLAIGRTKLQEAFMAINRAVFQPGRVELPEDKE